MKSICGKRFAQILESRGWNLVRVNGSHHIYMKSGISARISLPIHGSDDLKIGLLRHFMKIADVKEHEL